MSDGLKIKKENVEQVLNLLPIQADYLSSYFNSETVDSQKQVCMILKGRTDINAFNESCDQVIAENPTFRTVLRWAKIKQPLQILLKKHVPSISFNPSNQTFSKSSLNEVCEQEKKALIDLQYGAYKLKLVSINNESIAVILTYHPILIDEKSAVFFLEAIFDHFSHAEQDTCYRFYPEVRVPISPYQKSIYFLHTRFQHDITFNMSHVLKLRGKLDIDRLKTAFEQVVLKHEALRTTIELQGREILQCIHHDSFATIEVFDNSTNPDGLISEFVNPFDLEKGPLIRLAIVHLPKVNEYLLLLDSHHIIIDGFSYGVVLSDLTQFYQNSEISASSTQYRDFSERLNSSSFAEEEKYWLNKMAGYERFDFPYDFNRQPSTNYQGETVKRVLDQTQIDHIENSLKIQRKTLFSLVLSAFNLLLYKETLIEDITIGSAFSGRTSDETMNLVGLVMNTVLLRNKITPDQSLLAFHESVFNSFTEALAYEKYPYQMLLERFDKRDYSGRDPIFDFGINIQDFRSIIKNLEMIVDEAQMVTKNYPHLRKSKIDFVIEIEAYKNELVIYFDFNNLLFRKSRVEKLADAFITLMYEVIDNHHITVRESYARLGLPETEAPRKEAIKELINTHYNGLDGSFCNVVQQSDHSITVVSEYATDPNWNHSSFYFPELGTESQLIADASQCLTEYHRSPAIFLVEDQVEYIALRNSLKHQGYHAINAESWLRHNGNYDLLHLDQDLTFSNVSTQEELKAFSEVFNNAYRISSPLYTRLFHSNYRSGSGPEHFIGRNKSGIVVCIISYIIHNGKGICYNCGTHTDHKGREYGKAALSHGVKVLLDLDIKDIFLQTDKNSKVEALWREIGWEPNFNRSCFIKNDIIAELPELSKLKQELSGHEIPNIKHKLKETETNLAVHSLIVDLANHHDTSHESILLFAISFLLASITGQKRTLIGLGKEQNKKLQLLPFLTTIDFNDSISEGIEKVTADLEFSAQLTDISTVDLYLATQKEDGTEPFDIILNFNESEFPGSHCPCSFYYHENTLSLTSHLDFIGGYFLDNIEFVLKQVLSNDQIRLNQLDVDKIATERMRSSQEVVLHTDEVLVNYIKIFEAQVSKEPQLTALTHDKREITYQVLDAKANQLAREFARYGIKKNFHVPVFIDQSFDLAIAFLATLKVGATYVPIDIKWPAARIKEILVELNYTVVVTSENHTPKGIETAFKTLEINADKIEGVEKAPDFQFNPEDVAYIFFTSGSTGKPKGAQIPHRALMNRLLWMNEYFGTAATRRVYQSTRYVFDTSIWQFLWPLMNGGTCIIQHPQDHPLSGDVIKAIADYEISIIDLVPSVFFYFFQKAIDDEHIDAKLASLKYLIVGGESIDTKLAKQFKQRFPHINVLNAYGPTETTIGVTVYNISGQEKEIIPIGKPIANTKFLILNDQQKLVPKGVVGELYIHGPCVGHGYINDRNKTKEVFLDHPYIADEVVYKTGDLVQELASGEIHFIERKDRQIKLNGHRIEPQEITNKLLSHKYVHWSHVKLLAEGKKKYLCAYASTTDEVEAVLLKEFLSERLPAYMVPAHVVVVKEIPVSASGKLEEDKLPLPAIANARDLEPIHTQTEKELATVWAKLLEVKIEDLHRGSVFFDLGGDSITLMMLSSHIKKEFNKQISFIDLLDQQALGEMASNIAKAKEQTLIPDTTPQNIQEKEVSLTQKSIWYLCQSEEIGGAYNICKAINLKGDFDIDLFAEAVRAIVAKHELLRSIFSEQEDKVCYTPMAIEDVEMASVLNVRNLKESTGKHVDQFIHELSSYQFHLDAEPLFKVELIQSQLDEYVAVLLIHHLISDGASLEIILKDLIQLYKALLQGQTLPTATPASFHEYTKDISRTLSSSENASQTFWKKLLQDYSNLPDWLPKTKRSVATHYEGGEEVLILDEADLKFLEEIAKERKSTLFAVVMASIGVLFYSLSGIEKYVIGVPVMTRNDSKFQDTVGMFLNAIPVPLSLESNSSFVNLVDRVAVHLKHAMDHIHYPITHIIKELDIPRMPGRNPLFDVSIDMLNYHMTTETDPDLPFEITQYEIPASQSKYDLTFYVNIKDNRLSFKIEYRSGVIDQTRVLEMIERYKKVLSLLKEEKNKAIKFYQFEDEINYAGLSL